MSFLGHFYQLRKLTYLFSTVVDPKYLKNYFLSHKFQLDLSLAKLQDLGEGLLLWFLWGNGGGGGVRMFSIISIESRSRPLWDVFCQLSFLFSTFVLFFWQTDYIGFIWYINKINLNGYSVCRLYTFCLCTIMN